jgi:hypothetical protein
MNSSLDNFDKSLKKLEQLILKKFSSSEFSVDVDSELKEENLKLKAEIAQLKNKYSELVKTSENVINELNSSIQVIDNYFKKQDANNKNT